jgi:hypothetical protein
MRRDKCRPVFQYFEVQVQGQAKADRPSQGRIIGRCTGLATGDTQREKTLLPIRITQPLMGHVQLRDHEHIWQETNYASAEKKKEGFL